MKYNEFRNVFFKELDKKTGWGKNEIKELFDNVFIYLINIDIDIEKGEIK